MSWFYVALGGSLGAIARYALAGAMSSFNFHFPIATLIANILGSFLMGLLYVIIVEKALLPAEMRPLLMVGLLGAFTTFSTFSLESVSLLQSGQLALALAYIAVSVVGSIAALFISIKLFEYLIG